MAIHTKQVQRIRLLQEGPDEFGEDKTSALSSFAVLDYTSATVSYELPKESPNTMQAKMDGASYLVKLRKRATLTITCNLAGLVARAGGIGGGADLTAQGRLWTSFMGGVREGIGDVLDAGSTDSALIVDTIANWVAGTACAVVDSGGRLHARIIPNVNVPGDTVNIVPPLPDAPAENDLLFAAVTHYLGESASDDTMNASLQFACEGLAQDDRWLLTGGKVTGATLSLAGGQIASVTFTVQCPDWKYARDCEQDFSNDPAPLPYVVADKNGNPLVVDASDLYVYLVGDAEWRLIHASDIEIELSPEWVPVTSTSGVNGVAAWARNHRGPQGRVSFSAPLEDGWFFGARDEEGHDQAAVVHFQVGSRLMDGAMLFVVHGQVENVQPVEVDGLSYQRVTIVAGVPVGNDDPKIAVSPISIHTF